jgi:hypothetical protein
MVAVADIAEFSSMKLRADLELNHDDKVRDVKSAVSSSNW